MSNQPNLWDDFAHDDLPQADDYNPDANYQIGFQAGDPVQTWDEYGLAMVPINDQDGNDTGRRFIARNGELIKDVSEGYKLLPNEQLISVSNQVARDLGAVPFGDYDGDWFIEVGDSKHVFQNEERTRIHGVYAWQDGDVGGDEMSYGYAVHNSIDGSLGFSVGLFTFRHACQNMVFLGTGGTHEERALAVEDEREIVNRTKQAHTQSLAVEADELEAVIKGTLTLVDDVHETYQQWVGERITAGDVRDLLKRPSIAKKDLPNWIADTRSKEQRKEAPMDDVMGALEEATEERTEEGQQLPWKDQRDIITARMPQSQTKWEMYNDLTQAIWHEGSSDDNTRRRKMKDIHRIFEVAPDSDVTLR